jgi:general secretion pathway protein G
MLQKSLRIYIFPTCFLLLSVSFLLINSDFALALKSSAPKAAQAQIKLFEKAILNFRNDIGRFPTTEEGLNALINDDENFPKWDGPYLNKSSVPRDPWLSEYVYIYPAEHGTKAFDLYSLGANKKNDFGTEDDIANWHKTDLKYYRNLEFKRDVFLYSIVIIIISLIVLAAIKIGRPSILNIARRFTALSLISLYFLLLLLVLGPSFMQGEQYHPIEIFFIFLVCGCFIFSLIGVISISKIIRKDGSNRNRKLLLVLNQITFLIIIILIFLVFFLENY